MESSADKPFSLRARTYFDRKCTVSSTMIPSEIDATVATEKPTSPTRIAQAPNVARIGNPLGTMLRRPSRKLRSANIMIKAIATTAAIVPISIFCTFRSVI